MTVRPEERLQLWNLFQACDLDRDGLIDINDIRSLCKRTEFFEEYTPEAIQELFDMTDDAKIGFEEFVAKKAQLAYSESTSISSDLTNQTADESGQFTKEVFDSNLDSDSSDQDYDPDLSDYSSKADNYQDSLLKKLPAAFNSNSDRKSSQHRFPYKKFSGSVAEQIEGIDLSADAKEKIEQIHQNYVSCISELSRENDIICTRLERVLAERNYLREKDNKMYRELWARFNEEKDAWNAERQCLKEKIVDLESIVAKLSIAKSYDQLESRNWISEEPETDLENRLSSNLECFETPTISKNYLHRLSSQLAEKTLHLSEIISNLRSSEIGLLMANCRAAGLGRSVYLTDDDEQEEILQIYEQVLHRRRNAEREAMDFFRNLDRDFLLQYLPLDEYRRYSQNSKFTFDSSFEMTLVTLLAKFKRHFREINISINSFNDNKSSDVICDGSISKFDLKSFDNIFPCRDNIYSVKYNSL